MQILCASSTIHLLGIMEPPTHIEVECRHTSKKRVVREEWIDNKLQVRSEPVPWHKNLYLLKNKKMGGNTYNATTSCGL